jgi:hypothetical protein
LDEEKKNIEETKDQNAEHKEETAAELAAPVTVDKDKDIDSVEKRDVEEEDAGNYIGVAALILSIVSLFTMPVLFGAAGIIVGWMARRRGAESLGIWAIGIGAVSLVMGLFVLPFF